MSAAPQRLTTASVTAAVIGNALEFYDFITYAFFAVQIGRVFFPAESAYSSLMASLITFGVGFVMRPVGGIVIGLYADRVGRKPAMLLCIVLMGAAILAAAVTPSYAALGAAAPVLFVIARMVQGFALGGQVGSTTAYLLEAAPVRKRGIYASWQTASQYCASLTGGTVGFVLSLFMSPQGLQDYGWRIAFALGAFALPVAVYLLRAVPETLHRKEEGGPRASAASGWTLLLQHCRVITLGLIVLASATIHTYLTNYMTTYAQTALHLGSSVAFAATIVVGISGFLGVLSGGFLSDFLGRWPVMVWPRALYLLLIWPLYTWLIAQHDAVALFSTTAVLVFLGGMSFGPFTAALTESLPKAIRGTAFGTVYAISIAIFGGSAQSNVTWLIHHTGAMAPAWYLIVAGFCGLVATALMDETAPARLGFAAAPAE